MYNVSAAFKTAIKKKAVRYKIQGTIGNESFDDDNILAGSFSIDNQCSGSDEIQIGSVYVGQLTCTFIGLELDRYSVIGQIIAPQVGVRLADSSFEYVPMGIFTVQEAEWSAAGLTVKAYDNMTKFDKTCLDQLTGTLYQMARLACLECNATLANDDFSGFANATAILEQYPESDIETYRDLIYWIAQTLGAFVTANRDGEIEFRKYGQIVADTLDAYHRFQGGKFSDYVTRYTGLSVVDMREQVTKYYFVEPDNGLTYNAGSNPFLQMRANNEVYCEAVLTALTNISYVPFEITLVANPAYDLGDVLSLPDGLGDGSKLFCITQYSFNYNKSLKLKGAGKNPILANAQSKSDKSIQGLLSSSNKNEYQDYETKNTALITIGDQEEARICSVRLASNNSTRALIHMEVNLSSLADEITDTIPVEIGETGESGETGYEGTASGDDIFRLVSDSTTKATIRYLINSEEATLKPKERWIDGNHVLHLMYVQPLEAGVPIQFEAYMEVEDGTVTIPAGGVWFYGGGRGLVGDGKWNGLLEFQDEAAAYDLVEITFSNITESLSIDLLTPNAITVSDSAAELALLDLTFDSATDAVIINMYVQKYDLITEAAEPFVTEDGIPLVTEND